MRSMLVIDGSETIAKLFAQVFEKRGWHVVVCGDQDSAIRRLAANRPYDVILLGCRVPGTSAVQMVRSIKSFEHRRLAAVVMVTANDGISEEARMAGADDILLRPVNPNALIWTVDSLVTRSQKACSEKPPCASVE